MRLHTPVYADFWISDRGQHSWSIDEEHSREIIRRRLELGVSFARTMHLSMSHWSFVLMDLHRSAGCNSVPKSAD